MGQGRKEGELEGRKEESKNGEMVQIYRPEMARCDDPV